jgi:anaerobic selenocysteine-containing dehydrogenase
MIMYHSWGSQNAWLRQILGRNRLYVAATKAKELGIADGDWVWLSSHHRRIRVRVKTMEGLQPDTVWTWNAVGKRSGAWNLPPDAPEARQGFLLNHLISESLPLRQNEPRMDNADPITGQAAWFDLMVRIDRCKPGEPDVTAPQFAPLRRPVARTAAKAAP